MRAIVIAIGVVFVCGVFSCSKSNKAQNVSGTINGKPALTLYGSSNKPTDYLFISTDPTTKEMSYNGIVLTYSSTTPPGIFIIDGSVAIAKARLEASSTATMLTIDTAYGFSFGSKEYSSR